MGGCFFKKRGKWSIGRIGNGPVFDFAVADFRQRNHFYVEKGHKSDIIV